MPFILRKLLWKFIDCLSPRMQSRLMSLRSRTSARLGRGAYVHHSVQLLGKAFIRVGDNSVLSQECWLNVNHRHGDQPAIEIGDNCFIGRRNFFSSGKQIVIGAYVLTANDCQFLGSTHLVSDPMRPVLSTGTTDADVISVGANTFIGAGARIIGNVQIGHGCVIGTGSLVTRSIPPFSQAYGNPAEVKKRYSFPRRCWVTVVDFDSADEAALPMLEQYVGQLRNFGKIRMPYIAAGSDMGNC